MEEIWERLWAQCSQHRNNGTLSFGSWCIQKGSFLFRKSLIRAKCFITPVQNDSLDLGNGYVDCDDREIRGVLIGYLNATDLHICKNDHVVVIFHMRCLRGETIGRPKGWRPTIDLPKLWSADLIRSACWSDQRCWSRFGFSEYLFKPSFCYLSFLLGGGWFFETPPPLSHG